MCSEEKIAELRKNITQLTQDLEVMRQNYGIYSKDLTTAENLINEIKQDIENSQQAR